MSGELNSAQVIQTCNKRLAALENHLKSKSDITINGKTLKVASLLAIYKASIESLAALEKKRSELKASLAVRDRAELARIEADKALKPWVQTQFGTESQVAHEFGFPPRKKPVRTAESTINAATRNRATRAARHTMGKRQKEKIKGTAVVPTVPAAPAVSTTSGTIAAPSTSNGVTH
jgi:hypothetical protein